MKRIVFPLNPNQQNAQVADLQQALALLGSQIADTEKSAQLYGPSTQDAVRQFQTANSLTATGIVDEFTANALNCRLSEQGALDTETTYAVTGIVRGFDGKPCAGLRVRAFDRDIAREELLGGAVTDQAGAYRIVFSEAQYQSSGAEKGGPELFVRVYSSSEQSLVRSKTVKNAPKEKKIDVKLPEKPEFQRLSDVIRPLMGATTDAGWLDRRKLAMLRKKTGATPSKIKWLVQSLILSGEDAVLGQFYYALLSQKLSVEPDRIASLGRAKVELALRRAVELGLIYAIKDGDLDRILDHWGGDDLLRPAASGQPASLGDMLRTLPQALPDESLRKVADFARKNGIPLEKLEGRLSDVGLERKQALGIERTLRLGELTRRNVPLMRRLQEELSGEQDASLKALTRLRRDQWIDMASANELPAGAGQTPEEYAKQMEAAVEMLHPTAMIAARLKAGDLVIRRNGFEKVGAFLEANPDFDILTTNVRGFLDKPELSALENREQLAQSLNKLQRVRRITGAWDEAGALLNNGLDSPLPVVLVGKQRLRKRLAGTVSSERADAIHARAKASHDYALALMARVQPRFSPTAIPAMGGSSGLDNASIRDVLKKYPSLQELFGSLDYAECDPTLSVLSPAAYFVDLLQFLKNADALQALLNRRPDLVDLLYSPGNTKTEMPYIDLVSEILENAVALPQTVQVPQGSSGADALRSDPLPALITDTLQETSLETIGAKLQAQWLKKQFAFDLSNDWTVDDQRRRWTLHDEPGTLNVYDARNPYNKLTISAAELDMELMAGELDKGKFFLTAVQQVKTACQQMNGIKYLGISASSIKVVKPGRVWRVSLKLSGKIGYSTIVSGNEGSITIRTPQGETTFTQRYTSRAIQNALDGLQNGKIAGVLGAVLPGMDNAKISADGQEYRIEIDIDVIIEYIPEELVVRSLTYQTMGESGDLKASPANQNPLAYAKLRDLNFPWSLPFNLPLESVRAHLDRLGTSRRRLMELQAPDTYLSDAAWVNEMLGISPEEAALMVTSVTDAGLWGCWGLHPDAQGHVSVYDASEGKYVPDTSAKEAPLGPLEALSRVSLLLQQARISYDDLLKIIRTKYIVAGVGKLVITPQGEWRPAKMRIEGLKAEHLDRIHRFIRLWRRLGWEIEELDMVIIAFSRYKTTPDRMTALKDTKLSLSIKDSIGIIDHGGVSDHGVIIDNDEIDVPGGKPKIPDFLPEICPDVLTQAAHIKLLSGLLDQPVGTLLVCWGSVGTFTYRRTAAAGDDRGQSMYESVFLNPIVQNPSDPDFALSADGSMLMVQAKGQGRVVRLRDKITPISSALGIRKEELDQLLTATGLVDMTIASLHALYRVTALAKALSLSFTELFEIAQCAGCAPFGSTGAGIRFCEIAGMIRESGFTVEEISYLLKNPSDPAFAGSPLQLRADQRDRIVLAVFEAMRGTIGDIDQQVTDLLRNNPGPTVRKLTGDAEAAAADAAALEIGYALGDNASRVTRQLKLPSVGASGSRIVWTSASACLRSDGTPIRPDSGNGDRIGSLTASVQKGTADPVTREFGPFTILEKPADDKAALEFDAASQLLGFRPGDSATGVTGDLELLSTGPNGTSITWASVPAGFISSDGKVTRPVSPEDSVQVKLTATVKSPSGSLTKTRDCNLTVVKDMSDAEAVAADAAELEIGFASGDSEAAVTRKLILPAAGNNQTAISWRSTPDNIGGDGTIKRPQSGDGDIAVTVTATVKRNGAAVERAFGPVTVKEFPSDDYAAIDLDVKTLSIGYACGDSCTAVTQKIVLPSFGDNGSAIQWRSINPLVVSDDGTISRPASDAKDAGATLVATVSRGSAARTRIFYSPDLQGMERFARERLSCVLLDENVRARLKENVVQTLAGLVGAEPAALRSLLVSEGSNRAVLKKPSDQKADAVDAFIDPLCLCGEQNVLPAQALLEDINAVVARLHKAVLLLSRLNVKPKEIAWFADRVHGMVAVDINALPVAEPKDLSGDFAAWKSMVALFRIRNGSRGMADFLARYVGDGLHQSRSGKSVGTVIAEMLNMSSDKVMKAAQTLGMNALDDFRDALKLQALLALLSEAVKTGIEIGDMAKLTEDWSALAEKAEAAATEAERLARSLLRAKYGADSWREAVTPVSDLLRGKQRDALVDYLLQREELRDADELYEYYLIDPKMSPGMMTSRLVQASAAVQLFIQQCLMNRIHGVEFNEDDRKRWQWMKNYRVWEANRKVFLYPENWLFPELRDDKTAIFKQFESGLAQGEPNYQLAKDQLLTYMDGVSEVAKIKVYGMYYAEDGTLYAIGRTPNQPYRYYWRKCDDFGGVRMHWYGWEQIDLDINNDCVMPFVMEGNLHIAWPAITAKKNTDNLTQDWDIKLNWARFMGKGWGAKKVTKDGESISIKGVDVRSEVMNYATFRLYYPEDSSLILDFPVYLASNIVGDVPINPSFTSSAAGALQGGGKGLFNIQVVEHIKDSNGGYHYYYAKGYEVSISLLLWVWHQNPNGQIGNDQLNGEWTMKRWWVADLVTKDDGTCSFTTAEDFVQVEVNVKLRDGSGYVVTQCYPPDQEMRYPDRPRNERQAEGVPAPDQKIVNCAAYFNFMIQDAPPHREDAAHMEIQGKYRFDPLADIAKLDEKTGPLLPTLKKVTEFFGNGYKTPHSGGKRFELTINHAVVPDELKVDGKALPEMEGPVNNGEFFIVEAAKAKAVEYSAGVEYYEDTCKKIYIKGANNGSSGWFGLMDNIACTAMLRSTAYYNFDKNDKGFYSPVSQSRPSSHPLTIKMVSDSSRAIKEESIGFNLVGPSALYNWEIFYHAPMLAAEFLTRQQRFEDAQRWLHYLFDPTATLPFTGHAGAPATWGYWQFLPFREHESSTKELFDVLAKLATNQELDETNKTRLGEFYAEISNWLTNPFSPFAVARYRWSAFQWRTIFAYLDNLIAHGDQMFRRFTRESVNEAILYYILAAKLLGPRPRAIRPQTPEPLLSYRDIDARWEEFSKDWNATVNALNATWPQSEGDDDTTEALTSLGMSFFGIPHNEKLTEYWDKVEDRLFKIRNCMDIDGVTRELALFAPPIDPELLVRATAAGLDIDTVLSDQYTLLMPYRFGVILQKAAELCGDLKSLGGELLAALEKKDAEELSRLRSTNEIDMLDSMTALKEQQIKEAEANLVALDQSMALVKERFTQYQGLLGKPDSSTDQSGLPVLSTTSSLQLAAGAPGEEMRLGLIQYESDQLKSMDESNDYMTAAGICSTVASILHCIPDTITGNPLVTQLKIGGSHFGNAANAASSILNMMASRASHEANRKGLFATYQRRQDEWVYQSRLALEEMKQITKQKVAAEIRKAIAEKDLENHLKQIENAKKVDAHLHEKYTNQELYSWMEGEISSTFFASYRLAFDMAKRAEKAFRFERGVENTSFIQFGYWDNLKKGLLSGEKLSLDLKRMEAAYLEQNQREFEITRHLSLLQLDPLALVRLRETGTCEVSIPEALFDIDFAGHYFRRLKSVSLTIPCVAGPYTGINCTLRLLKHSCRRSALAGAEGYARKTDAQGIPADDSRFVDSAGMIQSIATSHGQNDSGMFELNFRDERYLPFEGAGAISTWRIELPRECRQFDYDTIADVVIHLKYTAREGGDRLRDAALGAIKGSLEKAEDTVTVRLLSLRHEFPTEWARFTAQSMEGTVQGVGIPGIVLRQEHFPYWSKGLIKNIREVLVIAKGAAGGLSIMDDAQGTNPRAMLTVPNYGDVLTGRLNAVRINATPQWSVPISLFLSDNTMEDVLLAVIWK